MRFSFISFMRLKRSKAPSTRFTPNRYPPVGPVCAWVHNSPQGESRMPMPLLYLTSAPLGVKRSEEHTSELQSLRHLVCRLLLEKKKNANTLLTLPQTTAFDARTADVTCAP